MIPDLMQLIQDLLEKSKFVTLTFAQKGQQIMVCVTVRPEKGGDVPPISVTAAPSNLEAEIVLALSKANVATGNTAADAAGESVKAEPEVPAEPAEPEENVATENTATEPAGESVKAEPEVPAEPAEPEENVATENTATEPAGESVKAEPEADSDDEWID